MHGGAKGAPDGKLPYECLFTVTSNALHERSRGRRSCFTLEGMAMDDNAQQLPVLDMSQPITPSNLRYISQACKELGYFLVSNHGISEDVINRLLHHAKHVFQQPMDAKLRAGPSSSVIAYTPNGKVSPFFESLMIAGPDYFTSAKKMSELILDHHNIELCKIAQEYGSKIQELTEKVISVLLTCLGDGIKRKYLDTEFGQCRGNIRINNYTPPGEIDHWEEKEVPVGLGEHTDMSCITLLYHDGMGVLQSKTKHGGWIDVKPVQGTFIVNVGDLLEAWSNRRFKASPHRVVLTGEQSPPRKAVVFFWTFKEDKVVFSPEEVVGPGNRRAYRPFTCMDYYQFRLGSRQGNYGTVNDFASAED